MKVAQSAPTVFDPMDYTVNGFHQARILEWVAFSSPGDLPNPGIKPRSPTLQVDSLPSEPHREAQEWVGSLCLLQQIFQPRDRTQVSCICRWILIIWATREAHPHLYQDVISLRPCSCVSTVWKIWLHFTIVISFKNVVLNVTICSV